MLSSPNRLVTTTPSDGSRTITVEETADGGGHAGPSRQNGTLRLQGGPRSQPRVAWDEGVIDNENCGRKKSKICCIYRKPKAFDESSDESSSSEDGSDSGDDGRARPPHRHHHHHRHDRDDHFPDGGDEDGNASAGDGGGTIHEPEEGHECNAYESQPGNGKGRSKD